MAAPKPTAQCPSDGRWVAVNHERADILEVVIRNAQAGRLELVTGHIGDLSDPGRRPAPGQAAVGGQNPAPGQTQVRGSISNWAGEARVFHPEQGGLRILLVDRLRYGLELPIQRNTFHDVIRDFKLSPRTLQSFDCDAGTYTRSYVRDPAGTVIGIRKY